MEMGEMFFYDIILLYRRYEEYLKEENEAQKQQEAEYREEMPSMPDYKNFNPDTYKLPTGNFDMNSISRGFSNGYSMPSMPSMPSGY